MVVGLQLNWETLERRLTAYGVLWELRSRLVERHFELPEQFQIDDVPGHTAATWQVDNIAEADQLIREIGDILDEIGWGRQSAALTYLESL